MTTDSKTNSGRDSANTSNSNDSTSQVANQAKQAANQVTDQVKQTAGQVADTAQHSAESQLSTRKNQAAQSVDSAVHALNQVSNQLRQDNQQPLAQVTDFAAQGLGHVSDYLQNTSVRSIVGDIENVARQQPALFLTGAFALGVIAARFIKSSGSATNQSNQWNSGWNQNGYANPRGWQTSSWQGNTRGWNQAQAREQWGNGAPYGVYDPGSTGIQVREVPQQ